MKQHWIIKLTNENLTYSFGTQGNTPLIIEYFYIIKRKWNMLNLLLLILSDIFGHF